MFSTSIHSLPCTNAYKKCPLNCQKRVVNFVGIFLLPLHDRNAPSARRDTTSCTLVGICNDQGDPRSALLSLSLSPAAPWRSGQSSCSPAQQDCYAPCCVLRLHSLLGLAAVAVDDGNPRELVRHVWPSAEGTIRSKRKRSKGELQTT